MSRRPIDPVDTIWLNMDRPNNLMVIESLMTLTGQVDWERFLGLLEHRVIDRYPVFRQRPVESHIPLSPAHWEDDEDFSVLRHVRRATLREMHLVAALAGALATYHRDRGVEPVDVPTMVPVNVRPADEPLPRELGNQFALVLVG